MWARSWQNSLVRIAGNLKVMHKKTREKGCATRSHSHVIYASACFKCNAHLKLLLIVSTYKGFGSNKWLIKEPVNMISKDAYSGIT